VRPHFQTVRVRAVVATAEPMSALAAVIEETEARCPVMNLLADARWTCSPSGSATAAARWRPSHAADPAPVTCLAAPAWPAGQLKAAEQSLGGVDEPQYHSVYGITAYSGGLTATPGSARIEELGNDPPVPGTGSNAVSEMKSSLAAAIRPSFSLRAAYRRDRGVLEDNAEREGENIVAGVSGSRGRSAIVTAPGVSR
jgi:hypothetical protein